MQRLIRQRTAGGRVQVPPTMQHGMAQVSAPLSPNILAEPYKYEPHPIIASHAMSAGRTDSLCVYNVAFSLSILLFDLHIMDGGGDDTTFLMNMSWHGVWVTSTFRQGAVMLGIFKAIHLLAQNKQI